VDREGKVAAVRCRAALDLGVETVFEGAAPGYKLENVYVGRRGGGVRFDRGSSRWRS